jgi:hypothetical protein
MLFIFEIIDMKYDESLLNNIFDAQTVPAS